MHNKFKDIEAAKDLFALRPYEEKTGWHGLMVGPSDNSVWDYGRPALAIELYIHQEPPLVPEGPFAAFGCISSIDDGGVSIFGPLETLEKALARLESLKVGLSEFHPHCPDKVALATLCQALGFHPDYW